MRRLIIVSLIVMIGLFSFGCLGNEAMFSQFSQNMGKASSTGVAPMMAKAAYGESSTQSATGPYVTKYGYIKIKVAEGSLQTKFESLKQTLAQQSTEISNVAYTEYADQTQYTLTVKVSPNKFDDILSAIQKFGEVKDLSSSAYDVTKQYIDLDTQIKSREIEVERLYQLYNKSDNVSDLIAVEKELTRVQAELESLRQQKQQLVNSVEKATISITMYETKPATGQFFLSLEDLTNTFLSAVSGAIILVVVGVGFLLPLMLVGAVLWMSYKLLVKKGKVKHRESEHSRIPPPQ